MLLRELLSEALKDFNNPAEILRKIRAIVHGSVKGNRKTCWVQVADYLKANPSTEGNILMYGAPDDSPDAPALEDQCTFHAVLASATGDILVNTMGGKFSSDFSILDSGHPNIGHLVLLKKYPVPESL